MILMTFTFTNNFTVDQVIYIKLAALVTGFGGTLSYVDLQYIIVL